MTVYNFYARPKDINDDGPIIVTPAPSIHTLKFILLDIGKYNTYELVNEQLVMSCFVEEHHCYKVLKMGWTINGKEDWYDEDTIPFSITTDPSHFIKGIRTFYNKPFNRKSFFNLVNSDNDFFYNLESIVGNDFDCIDMYFSRSDNWSLTKLYVKEIRTITYKNSYEH